MVGFGDRVRIRATTETTSLGLGGLEGDIYGFTTPSVTGVEVIGGAPEDYALNVSIEGPHGDFWFRPDLIELLHHNAGMVIGVGDKTAVRQADGTWLETGTSRRQPGTPRSSVIAWLRRLFAQR